MPNNFLALIIQARMKSTRFPNKVISHLCGAPLIERILQRVKKVKKIKTIILATTKGRDDDILVDIAKSNKVEVFRGSENDLVDRYYQAVKGKKISHILRLPADNPIPDPLEYNRLINYHFKTDNDFSSNIYNFLGKHRACTLRRAAHPLTLKNINMICSNNNNIILISTL